MTEQQRTQGYLGSGESLTANEREGFAQMDAMYAESLLRSRTEQLEAAKAEIERLRHVVLLACRLDDVLALYLMGQLDADALDRARTRFNETFTSDKRRSGEARG